MKTSSKWSFLFQTGWTDCVSWRHKGKWRYCADTKGTIMQKSNTFSVYALREQLYWNKSTLVPCFQCLGTTVWTSESATTMKLFFDHHHTRKEVIVNEVNVKKNKQEFIYCHGGQTSWSERSNCRFWFKQEVKCSWKFSFKKKKKDDACDCQSHSSWRRFFSPLVQLCCVIIFSICRAMGPWSEGIWGNDRRRGVWLSSEIPWVRALPLTATGRKTK